MNAGNFYTRTRIGLDNRVWLVLLLTLLLSGVLLGFKMAMHKGCRDIRIAVTNSEGVADKYHPQDRLKFAAQMEGAGEIVWDFGDNTPAAKGSSVIHSFGSTGSYFVTVTINGKCREFVNVVVHTPYLATPASDQAVAGAEIAGPDVPKAGEPVTYTTALNATTYEWNVLNAPEYPTQHTPTATYIFLSPGIKNIELKLDNGKVYRKTIQVLQGDQPVVDPAANTMPQEMPVQQQQGEEAAQEPEQQAAPKSTFIADEVFRDMLNKVTDGDKDASSFNQFLCSGAQTKVRDNGESWTTLGEFCSKIHSKKKFQIKSVVTIRDPNDKCVLQIQVKYKKKGFLGL